MPINTDENLLVAIKQLKSNQKLHGEILRQKYLKIYETYSTVNQVKKNLKMPVPAGVTINKLMDELLMDNAKILTKNLRVKGSDSLLGNASNNLLDNALKLIVNSNKLKVKVYVLAIIKNIFK